MATLSDKWWDIPGVMSVEARACQQTITPYQNAEWTCGRGPLPPARGDYPASRFGCYGLPPIDNTKLKRKEIPETSFENFHWWQASKNVCYDCKNMSQTRDLSSGAIPERYPYRYTSAKPSITTRTKKEKEIFRCLHAAIPVIDYDDRIRPDEIYLNPDWATEYMESTLMPFKFRPKHEFVSKYMPKGNNEPLYVPYKPTSSFDKYCIDYLYSHTKHDPLYRRRLRFKLAPMPEKLKEAKN